MEGIYFYWLAWISWVWTTFMMDKNHPLRHSLSFFILSVILLAPFEVEFLMGEYSLAAFGIALFLFFSTQRKKTGSFLYLFLSSFIIMLAYTSFLMFELFDPIWVLFDRKIMLGALGFYLAVLLHKDRHNRLLSLISGFLLGDIMYSVILAKFHFPYPVASLAFLDILFISLAMLVLWSAVETVISFMSKNTITHAEGEEQKTS
ncbi:YphA family membrane protein [Mesobacillus subterraneus]|uniref:Uncharacterized protein n=1 Tax=Mesobacillus subterraneus TaxID=285983 RepID=A0A427TQ26_9BACI|nr:hypothetical protein [Mesobacillus subterraneus]RSD26485.1 hypothetical protein EJA10_13860 [Mesobacillus subterraneus]